MLFFNIGKVFFFALMRYQYVEHNEEHFKEDCSEFFYWFLFLSYFDFQQTNHDDQFQRDVFWKT